MAKKNQPPQSVRRASSANLPINGELPTIRQLMAVAPETRDVETWLKPALQNAIALELSTIPPYLCAWWSIKDPSHDVANWIKAVWREEMRHLGLACNLLAGIGGHPNLKDVRSYPGPLPGDVHPGLIAKLQGLSYDALHLFMEIEYPEFTPLALLRAGGLPYPTIGDFYTAVLKLFQDLNPPLDETKQIFVPPGVFKAKDLPDVEKAIHQIQREGEGSKTSPTGTGENPAHYYRFGEVFYGKKLKYNEATNEWRFNGDPVEFPDVWPMAPTPDKGYLQKEVSQEVWTLLSQFDTTFTAMLGQLQSAWDKQDVTEYQNARKSMEALTDPARELMAKELPTRTGNYGPCFRLV
jgi:hypothetical protein